MATYVCIDAQQSIKIHERAMALPGRKLVTAVPYFSTAMAIEKR